MENQMRGDPSMIFLQTHYAYGPGPFADWYRFAMRRNRYRWPQNPGINTIFLHPISTKSLGIS